VVKLTATVYHVGQYPTNTARYVVLADIYLAWSEKYKAISTLEKGLEINPGAQNIKAKLTELKSIDE
jgi:hypothetical protein